MIVVQILILIAGLALIVFGADWLVDGASAIARKAGISEFVIGLTIVGFGTSMPELVVSLNGAISGSADISVGNVVGSNIFNCLLILGITSIVSPIAISSKNRRIDIPLTLAVTLIFIAAGMNKTLFGIGQDCLSRFEGVFFLALFAAYLFFCFKTDSVQNADESGDRQIAVFPAVLLVVAGLAALLFGGRFFVSSAQNIARALGVSDKFIAITVLAGGTSLPELATCVVAAVKKRGQLALGNVLGSNVFNILLILGCSAVVTPLSLSGMNVIDMLSMFMSVAIVGLCPLFFNKDRLGRTDGLIMLLMFAAYYIWLFSKL